MLSLCIYVIRCVSQFVYVRLHRTFANPWFFAFPFVCMCACMCVRVRACVCVTPALCQLLKTARPHCVSVFPLYHSAGNDWPFHWFLGTEESKGRVAVMKMFKCFQKGNLTHSVFRCWFKAPVALCCAKENIWIKMTVSIHARLSTHTCFLAWHKCLLFVKNTSSSDMNETVIHSKVRCDSCISQAWQTSVMGKMMEP